MIGGRVDLERMSGDLLDLPRSVDAVDSCYQNARNVDTEKKVKNQEIESGREREHNREEF